MLLRFIRWFKEKVIGMHVHDYPNNWTEVPNGVKVYDEFGYLGVFRGWIKVCKTCGKHKTKV